MKTAIATGLKRDTAMQVREKLPGEPAVMGVAGLTLLVAAARSLVDLAFVRMRMERFFIRAGAVLSGLP